MSTHSIIHSNIITSLVIWLSMTLITTENFQLLFAELKMYAFYYFWPNVKTFVDVIKCHTYPGLPLEMSCVRNTVFINKNMFIPEIVFLLFCILFYQRLAIIRESPTCRLQPVITKQSRTRQLRYPVILPIQRGNMWFCLETVYLKKTQVIRHAYMR